MVSAKNLLDGDDDAKRAVGAFEYWADEMGAY